MNEKKSQQLRIIVIAGVALLAGFWLGFHTENQPHEQPPEIYGTLLPTPKPLTTFHLTSQNNQPFTEKSLLGNWSLVFVGYTNCPDVCPTTLTALQQSVELMQTRSITVPKIIFISIDPERDTPEVLSKYIAYFNKDFMAATGSEAELTNIRTQLSAHSRKVAGASGDINEWDYLMEHTAALILINPRAELQAFLSAPHIPEQIVESVQRSVQYYQDVQ
jgi:protein SCO1/2